MKTLLPKSKKIIRFWIIEVAINLLALFLIIPSLSTQNVTAILIILVILMFAIVVFKVMVFCMNIFLFLEIKKKYDLMLMGGIGEE